MKKISVLTITKNGLKTSMDLKKLFSSWNIYCPQKFSNGDNRVNWYSETTAEKISQLFKTNDALICMFSLGAVIRLIAPHIRDKKTDPAVIVIDDQKKFVISTLSGHLGGANQLAEEIAKNLGSISVITTAADVNQTIPVDLLGKEFGWVIDDDSTVTKVSAFMVNEEKIGVFQDAGEKNWWSKKLPKNVSIYSTLQELKNSFSKGYLIISDKILDESIFNNAVVYRPKTLVVGIGLHQDTTKKTIKDGINSCLKKFMLSEKSIIKFTSIKKNQSIHGLEELSKEMKIPVEYFEKEELAEITIPNPSKTVQAFEGTPSVSEASAIRCSKGNLIVEKQKFPPDLTIAIARMNE